MEDLVKYEVERYFEAKPTEDYVVLDIKETEVTAYKDRLHNDDYYTARYNGKELVW
jgi:hypothetical protein